MTLWDFIELKTGKLLIGIAYPVFAGINLIWGAGGLYMKSR